MPIGFLPVWDMDVGITRHMRICSSWALVWWGCRLGRGDSMVRCCCLQPSSFKQ